VSFTDNPHLVFVPLILAPLNAVMHRLAYVVVSVFWPKAMLDDSEDVEDRKKRQDKCGLF